MSISPKQLAANRANAKRSTGPRTPAGKTASSLNAITHGFYSSRSFLPTEDPDEFDAFTDALFDDLQPIGPIETLLADRIIASAWRLRRALDLERTFLISQSLTTDAEGKQKLGHTLRALMLEDERKSDIFDKISRHESRLDSQFNRDLTRLHKIQARRLPQPSHEEREQEKRGLAEAQRRVRRSPKGGGVCLSPVSHETRSSAPKNGFVSTNDNSADRSQSPSAPNGFVPRNRPAPSSQSDSSNGFVPADDQVSDSITRAVPPELPDPVESPGHAESPAPGQSPTSVQSSAPFPDPTRSPNGLVPQSDPPKTPAPPNGSAPRKRSSRRRVRRSSVPTGR